MIDLTQKYSKKLNKPQIRVWCHPKSGKSDFWYVFNTIKEAKEFIKIESNNKNYRPEEIPLIAFDGYEMTEKQYREYKKNR